MAKKKGLTYEEKMIKALLSIPNPIEDKRHNLLIHFVDDSTRSNETRFSHIIEKRHELLPSDIKRIPQYIKKAIFKVDKERKETYSIYIKRNTYSDEYIKISIRIDEDKPHDAYVKTVFITKNLK